MIPIPIEELLPSLAAGRMAVLIDRDGPDNMALVLLAAQFATSEALNIMMRGARGSVYLALTAERCDDLGLELVGGTDDSIARVPATVTIEARGVRTGIGLEEQAQTIALAIDPAHGREAIAFGGHVSPLRSRPGGVLERAGPTEAAIDLVRAAGLLPAAILCEIHNDDGSATQGEEVDAFCRRHDLPGITISEVIAYRRRRERLVEREIATTLPTAFGEFVAIGYRSLLDPAHHLALVKGDVRGRSDVLAHVHRSCRSGDVFHSVTCGCGERIHAAMGAIEAEGLGVLVYLAERDDELHRLQLEEERWLDFGVGAQILVDLGLTTIRLLASRPHELHGLAGYRLTVTGLVPLVAPRHSAAAAFRDPGALARGAGGA